MSFACCPAAAVGVGFLIFNAENKINLSADSAPL